MNRNELQVRRPRGLLSQLTVNHLHLRNPYVVAFFAFSYPGFGNLMQHRYAKGFILVLWEVFINHKAKVNLGIMHSLQGNFEQAKQVTDQNWLILYVAIYMFAIWDSFRTTIELNKIHILADREKAPIQPIKMGNWDMNYLDKRKPWHAFVWSIFMPGLGHMFVHKVISGFFIFAYTTMVLYFSHLPLAIHQSLIGNFDAAKQTVDMQWMLYLPSIYCFIFYDAYVSAVELNRLFDKEQNDFLERNYQNQKFAMPI